MWILRACLWAGSFFVARLPALMVALRRESALILPARRAHPANNCLFGHVFCGMRGDDNHLPCWPAICLRAVRPLLTLETGSASSATFISITVVAVIDALNLKRPILGGGTRSLG